MSFFDNLANTIELLLPKEIAIIVLSMLPYFELKGAIPLGISLGMSYRESFIYSLIGSFLPSPIIIFVVTSLLNNLKDNPQYVRFLDKYKKKVRNKKDLVKKWGYLGLFIFVAIPLPGTGVWTGSFLASIFKMEKKKSMLVIFLGNICAGLIITFLSIGIHKII